MKIKIESIEEFKVIESRGFKPLLNPYFLIDISVRLEIQEMLFGKPTKSNDDKFYQYCWNNKLHFCEESALPLEYSASHISHILTKGSRPEIRHDVRNINILSFKYHNAWEYGNEKDKEKMKIYWKNKSVIELLNKEYSFHAYN